MGWEEIMTENMSKDIIHAWRGTNEGLKPESLIQAAKWLQCCLVNGYIDLMLVETHYLNDPLSKCYASPEEKARILIGEAAMWSELVA
jgi:hexosaminidase